MMAYITNVDAKFCDLIFLISIVFPAENCTTSCQAEVIIGKYDCFGRNIWQRQHDVNLRTIYYIRLSLHCIFVYCTLVGSGQGNNINPA